MLFFLGSSVIYFVQELGNLGLFTYRAMSVFFQTGCSYSALLQQMLHIGVNSRNVVALTGSAIGAVLAKHGYDGLHRFDADQFLGPLVYLAMTREFGSVISAIMVIARAGSAMTAEVGSMNISEQIDALTTLSIDPIRYVVVPRILATTLIMPLLSLFCVIFGVGAGYVVAIHVLHINSELYLESIRTNLLLSDITKGLIKAAVFGFLSSVICSYKGINARGGAKGIGVATTQAVVISCVTVFLVNYVLTSLLFHESV